MLEDDDIEGTSPAAAKQAATRHLSEALTNVAAFVTGMLDSVGGGMSEEAREILAESLHHEVRSIHSLFSCLTAAVYSHSVTSTTNGHGVTDDKKIMGGAWAKY